MGIEFAPPGLVAALLDEGGPLALLAVYCALIVGASLVGGWLPTIMRLTHIRTQVMVSFVAGLMLGIALLHLLPHAVAEIGRSQSGVPDREVHAIDEAVLWTLGGLLAMFFLIRAFHFHHHGDVELMPAAGLPDAGPHDHDHRHGDGHGHAHTHGGAQDAAGHRSHAHAPPRPHGLSWLGVFFGLAVHTLIDGMALAASVQAEAAGGSRWGLYGLGTFLAILLHKPLDAVSITSLMAAGGWSARGRNVVNAGFALMCPLGAALLVVGADRLGADSSLVVGCALAFSAGVFLCISLGDLLPEVEFHSHDRLKLSAALLAGIGLAWGIGLLEPEHAHGGRAASAPSVAREPRASLPRTEAATRPAHARSADEVLHAQLSRPANTYDAAAAVPLAAFAQPNSPASRPAPRDRTGAATPIGRITHRPIREASGLTASRRFPGVYWTVCDSGQPPNLYAIDRTGRLLAEYRVEGAINFDWESIAIDDEHRLYIGDVGNNIVPGGLRRRIVFRAAEPDPGDPAAGVKVERAFWYRFPERPFDVEGTFFSGGHLYLVRKVHARDEQTAVYRLPLDSDEVTVTLEEVCRLPDLPAITGADLSPDGRRLALCGYRSAFVYDLPEDHAWERLPELRPVRFDYRAPSIESCAWDAEHADTLLILSEDGPLYAIAVPPR